MFIDTYINNLWIYIKFVLTTFGYISATLILLGLIWFSITIIVRQFEEFKDRLK